MPERQHAKSFLQREVPLPGSMFVQGYTKKSLDVLAIPNPPRLKIAQKPYIVWSLGRKALQCESLEPKKNPKV